MERLNKQLIIVTSEKAKLEEKIHCFKSDIALLKQEKEINSPSNKQTVLIMKCIKKQAVLIENLLNQISFLEQEQKPTDFTSTDDGSQF